MAVRNDMTKDSGDVHPPELEDEGAGVEATPRTVTGQAAPQPEGAGDAAFTGAESPSRSMARQGGGGEQALEPAFPGMRLDAATERYLDAARDQVRARPIASAATAFAIGFVLAIVTRR